VNAVCHGSKRRVVHSGGHCVRSLCHRCILAAGQVTQQQPLHALISYERRRNSQLCTQRTDRRTTLPEEVYSSAALIGSANISSTPCATHCAGDNSSNSSLHHVVSHLMRVHAVVVVACPCFRRGCRQNCNWKRTPAFFLQKKRDLRLEFRSSHHTAFSVCANACASAKRTGPRLTFRACMLRVHTHTHTHG